MGRIKGAAIRARLEFLRAIHGPEAVTRAIGSLEPMDQVILSGTLLPSIWYPFHVLANLDDAVQRELGDGGHEMFESAGEHVARQHARSIYKVFFRESDPDRVLKLASCIFGNYWSGLGRVTVRPGTSGASRVQISDAPVSARSNCVTSLAYFRTVLEECCQMRVSARETRCRCWGDDACEFEYAWEPALKQAI
jgi:predicted hydrocarbon binding protein